MTELYCKQCRAIRNMKITHEGKIVKLKHGNVKPIIAICDNCGEKTYKIERPNEAKSHEDIISIKHRRYEDIVKQVDNLLLNYTSSQNSENQLITSEEYTRLRLTLLKEKNQLEAELNATGRKIEEWLELSERTFNFVRYASIWFAKGDADTKRAIFSCLGSNLTIKDQKLSIQLKKPFNILFEGLPEAEKELIRLEPLQIELNRAKFVSSVAEFPLLSG